MKLSLRTKLMAVLVLAPALLLLAAIAAIWALDYKQRVAEQGAMFRSEAIQVSRSLRLIVERSIGSLNDFISLGDVAGLLATVEDLPANASVLSCDPDMRQWLASQQSFATVRSDAHCVFGNFAGMLDDLVHTAK